MTDTRALMDSRELRKLSHQAVTEGVNLAYVERMRQALYAAADRLEELEAGDVPQQLICWIVRDEGDSLAFWGPYPTETAAYTSGLYDDDGSSAIVWLKRNPIFAVTG